MSTGKQLFKEYHRSTSAPLDVTIDGGGAIGVLNGVTVVVNKHGALIRIGQPLELGSRIKVTVYLTSKTANARVVYVSLESPLTCGIELDEPQNIWGVPLIPDDWERSSNKAT